MAVSFDVDFVTLCCTHPKCGEIFEKSVSELAGAEDVYCPRCGTAARIGEENRMLAAAGAPEKAADLDKATR